MCDTHLLPNDCIHEKIRAFTLIELLTVIAIIGILAAIIIPVVGKVRGSAQTAVCKSNLRQISTAFALYAEDNRGYYPAARQSSGASSANPNQASTDSNWLVELAPYTTPKLQWPNAYRMKMHDPKNNPAYCPTYFNYWGDVTKVQTTYNTLGYGMNYNLNVGGARYNKGTTDSVATRFPVASINNPSRNILVGDSSDFHLGLNVDASLTSWPKVSGDTGKPDGCSTGAPTRHAGKANYLFADGHIETLNPDDALKRTVFQE